MNDKEKVDYKSLNQIIKSGNLLLKIILILMILSIGAVVIYLFDKTGILVVIRNILTIISPLFIGLVLSWLLEPAINYLVKNKVNRKLSAFAVYLVFVFIILLIVALIVPEFVTQLNELIKKVPEFLVDIKNFINDIFKNFSSTDFDLTSMKENLIKSIDNSVNNFTTNTLSGIIGSVGSSIKVLINTFLGLLIAFYLSLDFSKVSKYTKIIIPVRFRKDLYKLKDSLNEMLRSYVSGTLLSCLLVMIFSFIGFLISGLQSPLLFAIFCAITNIIPYFGPYISGIPIVIIGFANNPFTGLICLITVIIVQVVEGNIIHPIIIGKAVSLHPITMIIGLLIFEYLFGIIGMIVAAPIMATLKILFIFFNGKYHFMDKIKT